MNIAEETLANITTKKQNPLVHQLLQQLDNSVVYNNNNNINTNRKLWDNYCIEWNNDIEWVQKMASNVHMENDLKVLGDEWSTRQDKDFIFNHFILPYLHNDYKVAEIGVGGGTVYTYIYYFNIYIIY